MMFRKLMYLESQISSLLITLGTKKKEEGEHTGIPKPLTKSRSFSIFHRMSETFSIQYFVCNGLKRILSVSMLLGVLIYYLTS